MASVNILNKVKLPPYKPNQPELWFDMVERTFRSHRIKEEEDKVFLVSFVLNQQVLSRVRGIMISMPDRPYEKLKLEIIKHRIEFEEMGAKKPSQFLRHLRRYAISVSFEEIVQDVWFSRLPPNIQSELVNYKNLPLEELAKKADLLMSVVRKN